MRKNVTSDTRGARDSRRRSAPSKSKSWPKCSRKRRASRTRTRTRRATRCPDVPNLVVIVPADDNTRAVGEIEDDFPSSFVLKKDAHKRKTNAQLDVNAPTPLSSGGIFFNLTLKALRLRRKSARSIHASRTRTTMPSGKQTRARARTARRHLSDSRVGSAVTFFNVTLRARPPHPRSTATRSRYASRKANHPTCHPRRSSTRFSSTPRCEPPPPRGGLSEHSRPRTRGHLRAQLPQEAWK